MELHAENEPSIPGFSLVKQKIRKKSHKGPEIAGGLAVFVKNKFSHLVKCIPNNNNDSIWIKIKKGKIKETGDILAQHVSALPKRTKMTP